MKTLTLVEEGQLAQDQRVRQWSAGAGARSLQGQPVPTAVYRVPYCFTARQPAACTASPMQNCDVFQVADPFALGIKAV